MNALWQNIFLTVSGNGGKFLCSFFDVKFVLLSACSVATETAKGILTGYLHVVSESFVVQIGNVGCRLLHFRKLAFDVCRMRVRDVDVNRAHVYYTSDWCLFIAVMDS